MKCAERSELMPKLALICLVVASAVGAAGFLALKHSPPSIAAAVASASTFEDREKAQQEIEKTAAPIRASVYALTAQDLKTLSERGLLKAETRKAIEPFVQN
jgi:hypothetical protein